MVVNNVNKFSKHTTSSYSSQYWLF